jgi:uncharacterized protein YecE (DUF72 family)
MFFMRSRIQPLAPICWQAPTDSAGGPLPESAVRLRAGTSGWSFREWAGLFYPKGLPAGDWLAYYASQFDAVELNSSFYGLPRPASAMTWRQKTPPGFRFAAKFWREITHAKGLRDAGDELERFFASVAPLGDRLGPILTQLPPSLKPDGALLDDFLALAREKAGALALPKGSAPPLVVEFRHRGWLKDEARTREILDRHQAALCLSDWKTCPVDEPNAGAPLVYVRRHGPGERYASPYPEEALAEDARRVRGWLADGREVYVFFNNTMRGDALTDAKRLRELSIKSAP